MPYKVFFCEPSGRGAVEYIRVSHANGGCASGFNQYHRAVAITFEGDYAEAKKVFEQDEDRSLYPVRCTCGYEFKPEDDRSRGLSPIYRRTDTGEEIRHLTQAPIGACWDATWYREHGLRRTGPDGRQLVVQTPGGCWDIDSRASNCTLPNDDVHRCWVRHGKPEDGTLHVDKNGNTCQAGAGSIVCGSYHGFLHNGFLTDSC